MLGGVGIDEGELDGLAGFRFELCLGEHHPLGNAADLDFEQVFLLVEYGIRFAECFVLRLFVDDGHGIRFGRVHEFTELGIRFEEFRIPPPVLAEGFGTEGAGERVFQMIEPVELAIEDR